MANLVTYAKQKWEDAKTAITAARLNHMEDGINDCATQINALGDSVSRCVDKSALFNGRIRFEWGTGRDGLIGLLVYADDTQVAFLPQNTGM